MEIENLDDGLSHGQKICLVVLIFVVGFLLNLSCFEGLVSSDDLGYYSYAKKIAEGNYSPEHHHYAIRYGLIIPVAFFYKLFGINEWTTVLVPFLSSILSVPLLIIIAWRLFGFTSGIIAGVLLASFPVQLRYSTILLPETVANFYILIALVFYVTEYKDYDFIFSILSGIFISFGYLTKEPAIFVIVALLFDAVLKKKWNKLIGLILGCGSIIILEHIYYLFVNNDLLFRSHAMVVHNKSTMAVGAYKNLFGRLVIDYPRRMIVPSLDFGLHSILSILISTVVIKIFKVKRILFLILWALIPWLYLNFGTSSFSKYLALPTSYRYIMFVYSPLFILTGAVISRMIKNKPKSAVPSFLLVGIIVLSGFICGYLMKGRGTHTGHAKALKLIINKAEEIPLTKCVISLPNNREKTRWQRTVEILSNSIRINEINEINDEQALIIKRGDLGLPEAHLKIIDHGN